MVDNAYTSLNLERIRVVRLGPDGVPLPGANNLYVADGLIRLGYVPVVQAATRITIKDGSGRTCLDWNSDDDRVTGYTLTIEHCRNAFELEEMLLGGTLLTDSGANIGIADPPLDAPRHSGVTLEGWAVAVDGDQQALHPITGRAAYIRYIWPRTKWVRGGNKTLNNGASTPEFTGKSSSNANFYDGPGNDVPLFDGPFAKMLDDDQGLPAVTNGYATLTGS